MFNLGKKIAAIRKRRGITQATLADMALISLRTFKRIENNQTGIHIDDLNRIAEALRCTVDQVLDFDLDLNEFLPSRKMVEEENEYLKKENRRLQLLASQLLERLTGEQ